MSQVRTRFAPSPTGFIHLGNIRSALYPWAFARANNGVFILRIEDTDVERSSQEAVDVILEGMQWLGLNHDEGPYYQMQRMDRYKEVLQQMLDQGLVYPCYMSTAELDALRERQMANKEKPRYDGTWRPEPGKTLPPVPEGVKPVLRFKNPQGGSVVWDDKVKGRIEISNDELDDLVIARPDGTPTYNFCVVVDDMDMGITHVIRGDDHVNNTPRQINILRALGQEPPVYAHLPTVLNEQGEKMSKRHGAKAVTQYRDEGYLSDAIVNYLARLGWSHGDDEIFSRQQLVEWFNLDHLGKSAGQFDEAKLRWVAQQHMKTADDAMLAGLVREQFARHDVTLPAALQTGDKLTALCALFKDRCATTVELMEWLTMYVQHLHAPAEELAAQLTEVTRPAVQALAKRLESVAWEKDAISQAIKDTLKEAGLKMPQLAIPVRLLVCGRSQTPSVDAVLALFEREDVLARLARA
ncbi:MAG: glutamate--tRNA ligase [Aquabacterium sp.]|jgi:glutamyl-tRNA synthetase|uniref:glutamate--tRNA ligase n=1 Tax=Aquabacterium sp. TaxID=1872578 RepID=UPI002A36E37E|nr:glutamate--tRNA ligase [Aquabacterium sp.]MDX9845154.1 glutamate--tRNA ligase [Aquabacterium sp.]